MVSAKHSKKDSFRNGYSDRVFCRVVQPISLLAQYDASTGNIKSQADWEQILSDPCLIRVRFCRTASILCLLDTISNEFDSEWGCFDIDIVYGTLVCHWCWRFSSWSTDVSPLNIVCSITVWFQGGESIAPLQYLSLSTHAYWGCVQWIVSAQVRDISFTKQQQNWLFTISLRN